MSTTVETAIEIRPFQVDISDDAMADLRRRIAATRWPTKELVADRSQGVQLATIRALADYWANEYDFGRVAARLNALPQFTTEIDGVDIHFIHVKSRHENALPLVMTHGWPGSVIELLDTIGPLTDPTAHGGRAEDAFDLVLPSLPGYGFSSEPAELGWDAARTGRAWAELMHRLGYTRYVAQGGDVGALVTDLMGRQAVEGLVGYPPEPAHGGARSRRSPAQGIRAGTRSGRRRSRRSGRRLRLLPRDGNAAADDRLRPAGFTRRAGGLAARSRHGQLLQDRPRLRRREAHGQPDPGQHRRQHHAVLADRHRRFGGPVVLGGRTSAGRGACERPAASGGHRSGRLHDVPRRDLGVARGAGSRRSTPTSPTSTRPPRAATSPPGKSRSCSPTSCAPRSGRYATSGARREHCGGNPHRDPPLPRRHHGRGTRRPPSTHRGHELAREGDRRGSISGRAAGHDAEARALLDDGLRLAHRRGDPERPPAVHHRDRRARYSLHSRSFAA